MANVHDHVNVEGLPTPGQKRALWWALALNVGFMVAEVAGGVVFGSLSLLADGVHLLTDVASLVIALVALGLMVRPATGRMTFGMQRAEVLAAQFNGFLLAGASVWIAVEAIRRMIDPSSFDGWPVLVIGALGLVVNAASAGLLSRQAGRSLNVRSAALHMLADAATSLGVIVAAVAALAWAANWVDPAVSIMISLVVLWSAWRLLRETTHMLLEGTPRHLDPDEVSAAINADPAVTSVHHLHLWNLTSERLALSAHVVLGDGVSLHEAQQDGDRLRAMLHDQFGVAHSTLELECHQCDPPVVMVAEPRTDGPSDHQ